MSRWPTTGPIRYRLDILVPATTKDPGMELMQTLPLGDEFLYGPQDHVILYEDDDTGKPIEGENWGVLSTVPVYSKETSRLVALFFSRWSQVQIGMRSNQFRYLNNLFDRKRRAFLIVPENEEIRFNTETYSEFGLKLTPEMYDEWCEQEIEKVCLFGKDSSDNYSIMAAMNFRKTKYPLDIFFSIYAL